MSENDMKPESPKEAVNCDSKEDEEEAVNSSGECDIDSSQATTKEERENTDEIIGVELDYEEEVCFERDDKDKKSPCPDKKDEIELEKRSNDEPDDEDDEKDKKSETQQSQDTKDGEKEEDDIEEGEDEGEISDGDDLEEGELKDASPKPEATRQVCRFYGRGQCFYGNACRFLHLNHEKGQYSMFAPPRYSPGYAYGPPVSPMINDRSAPRMSGEFMNVLPLPMQAEPSPVESAWERGLREAKELVKKANKRKEEEPDFDKKKLNLSIHVNERNTPDYDKENDYFSRSYTKRNDAPYKKYDEPIDIYDNDVRAAREHFRGGRYENFEIRYTRGEREDMPRDRRARERSHTRGRMSSEREHKYTSKENRHKDRLKDDRMFDIQMRNRAFHYIDPWRRSKTPKARRTRSRSGSYSSVSSYSYSDRSSRSSSGYSRSSSRSSCASSRSPSPVMHKRKASPTADAGLSPKAGVNRFAMIKKKPANRPGASTSRSRSVSRTPSISRSRSSSISMDSVSSASSSVSSSASESLRNRNSHMSLLRKKTEDKLPLDKLENARSLPYDREQPERDQNSVYPDAPVDREAAQPFPSFQHLLPGNDVKAKSQHKQQIKLTLLNKPTTSKAANFPKKELDRSKLLTDQKDSSKSDVLGYSSGAPKRPLSPTLSAMNSKPNPLVPKKSASSRRDELLKQLKAVEDAIARKRAKFC